jgi:thiamine-monophosphate kinase
MAREAAFIEALKAIATDPSARGLLDDAALLPRPAGDLVLTHDMIVEGVHFLSDDAPADVAWKLVAVNLSDLAAKGARPLGVLLGYAMTADEGWDSAFAEGLHTAVDALGVSLLGGDTVMMPKDAPRALGLTAIGAAPSAGAPSRTGARPGDNLWVSGTVGDAALGLAIRQGRRQGDASLVGRYLRPQPRLALGQAVSPLASAMADVSDGLLIDASRIAAASGCAIRIDLDAVPLSPAFMEVLGDGLDARLFAATGGDDYELLFAASPDTALPAGVTKVGRVEAGEGLSVMHGGSQVPLPGRLGFQHG